jgi:IS30 family transposase
VGIGRHTGYRWRAERGGMPPARLMQDVSGRYLSLLERERIAALRRMGLGVREISREIGRSPSTVSRELRRNARSHDRGVYDAVLAHARAREQAGREKTPILARDSELRALVQTKLELEWSPEQIAGWLRITYPERTTWHLCHETIYQALYHAHRTGLARGLTRRLRTGRPLRKRRRRPDRRQVRFLKPGRLIHERPGVVESRSRYGDWEGDLIMGTGARTAVVTLVERRSRYVHLVALPEGHGADAVVRALTPVLAGIPAACRHTLTWDQGGEMANHHHIAEYFSEGVFFTEPGSPWQKPTVENTNGLIRQYLPKHLSVARDRCELDAIAERLNHRPRKTHQWRSPTEVLAAGFVQLAHRVASTT